MRETMEWILSTWKMYWAEGYYQYLLLIAAVYLLIWKRKKEAARQMLAYMAVVLAVFFFPVTARIIFKCIGESVYWRVLWILPVVPLIACAGTELVMDRKKPAVRVLLLVVVAVAIALGGKSVWQAGNYVLAHNYQKVPDEVAQICDMINSDRKGADARLAADDHISSYVRVYDPSISMAYSRGAKGARSKKSVALYQEMTSVSPNYKKIAKLARSRRCAYLAVQLPGEKQRKHIEKYEYELLGMVNDYGVFVNKKFIK